MTTANEVVLATMQKVQGVAKKDKNAAQGFNFRGIDAVLNAVGPAIREAGGFIVPAVYSTDYSSVLTAKGGTMQVCRLTVDFAVYGSEGAPISGRVSAEAFDSGDKATSKAMSVAYRTFLLQLLCLPTDEPDPDSFSYETVNWLARAELLKGDVKALRNLWTEAKAANAPKEILDAIQESANANA